VVSKLLLPKCCCVLIVGTVHRVKSVHRAYAALVCYTDIVRCILLLTFLTLVLEILYQLALSLLMKSFSY